MEATERIKPISYLKANPTEIVSGFDGGQHAPIIITQNGEASKTVYLRMFLPTQRNFLEHLTNRILRPGF